MTAVGKAPALKAAIFNASNISGLAAIFMSFSIGSLAGTLLFTLAVLVGTYNKYQGVLRQRTETGNILKDFLTAPSLTAMILMTAAFINFLKAGFDAVIFFPDESFYFTALALGWLFGVLGDDALRRNDRTNFARRIIQKNGLLWLEAVKYVTRNPVFYYLFTNVFFVVAVAVGVDRPDTNSGLILSLNAGACMAGLGGITYGIYKGWQLTSGVIAPAQANDGVINAIISVVNFILLMVAALQDFYWLAFSQVLFIAANIICLYETRAALALEEGRG